MSLDRYQDASLRSGACERIFRQTWLLGVTTNRPLCRQRIRLLSSSRRNIQFCAPAHDRHGEFPPLGCQGRKAGGRVPRGWPSRPSRHPG